MSWKRVTINLEPTLAELAKKRAKAKRQSVASYFASLLEEDVARHPVKTDVVEEKPAAYGQLQEIEGGNDPGLGNVPAPPHVQNPPRPYDQRRPKRA